MSIVPPEFIVYKPSLSNRCEWVIEIIDPPTQGVYKTESYAAGIDKEILKTKIEHSMIDVYLTLGLEHPYKKERL